MVLCRRPQFSLARVFDMRSCYSALSPLGVFSHFRALKRNLLAQAAHKRTDTKILYFDLLSFSIGEEKEI